MRDFDIFADCFFHLTAAAFFAPLSFFRLVPLGMILYDESADRTTFAPEMLVVEAGPG